MDELCRSDEKVQTTSEELKYMISSLVIICRRNTEVLKNKGTVS